MRRRDREITSRDEIDGIIRRSRVCRLGFAVENEPYVVPLSFGYDGEAFYFHTAKAGRKIDCIEANARVCFELEGHSEVVESEDRACDWSVAFESVIGYGTVRELTEPDDKLRGLQQIMLQYSDREWEIDSSGAAPTRVWRLEVELVTGKKTQ